MLHLAYYIGWYARCRLLGKRIPIQSVVHITSRCNLSCKHCVFAAKSEAEARDFSFDYLRSVLKECYDAGSRMVTFEGGEPLLWRDGNRTVEDLVAEARKIGFISTSYSTNGTLPIPNSGADRIFVSLDGTREYHDAIRGDGVFDQAMRNIEESPYPRINVNMAINTLNWKCVPDVIELVARTPNINGISLSFHTPHPGTESLFLPWERRRQVLDEVIRLKKKGYPIVNSMAGLKRMYDNAYTKRCWITNFALPDGKIHPQCPGAEEGICDRCGYGMGAEMSALYDLSLSTIIEGLRLFLKRG